MANKKINNDDFKDLYYQSVTLVLIILIVVLIFQLLRQRWFATITPIAMIVTVLFNYWLMVARKQEEQPESPLVARMLWKMCRSAERFIRKRVFKR